MARVLNFSAGPCTLPEPVLERARDEMLDYRGTGMSVMEMSHRSAAFEGILADAEARLRRLAGLSEKHRVLFLQGGATLQFSMVPLSLLGEGAAYVVTGTWGQKAVEAARMVGPVTVAYDAGKPYRSVPTALDVPEGARYVHATSNETIQGVEWEPSSLLVDGPPLVADVSSDFLSKTVDFDRYGLAYAGAQKNLGPAGLTVVIVREDVLAMAPEKTHPMLDYRLMAANGSLYNTPACWSIYVAGLVMEWMESLGGLTEIEARNERKAGAVYGAIDGSGGFYKGHADPEARSRMNVTFTLPDEELTKSFFAQAKAAGMDGLPGHRSVGGVRASMYNAFPEAGAAALADLMTDFVRRHG